MSVGKKYFSSYKKIKADENFDALNIYEKVKQNDSIILQSGQKGDFSIIGFEPSKTFSGNKDFLVELENETKKFQLDLEIPFTGGALGFFTYDFGVNLLGIRQKVKEDIKIPKAYFIFPSKIIVKNHKTEDLYLIGWAESKEKANKKLEEIKKTVSSSPIPLQAGQQLVTSKKQEFLSSQFSVLSSKLKSNLTKQQYSQKIKELKKLLKAGETYQVNLSQRFSVKTRKDPFDIYKILTNNNPSPYQLYFETKNFSIISNSPERLFRVRAEFRELRTEKVKSQFSALSSQFSIESRPIKGTVPRGKTDQEDKKLIEKLLNSKKEQAELDMITDLVRNDLGRICVQGSVEVNEDRVIESYGNVHHTVSNVRGVLNPSTDLKAIMQAIFPGGSITGCPKLRTIKIIDKLEDFKRTIYCGSAGYIDGRGNMDFNIMIRSILSIKNRELRIENREKTKIQKTQLSALSSQLYFHSGGGITIDSKTNDEYDETLHKAKAIIRAIN